MYLTVKQQVKHLSKEDYKKIITGVLQERPIDQIEGISDVIDKMTENVE